MSVEKFRIRFFFTTVLQSKQNISSESECEEMTKLACSVICHDDDRPIRKTHIVDLLRTGWKKERKEKKDHKRLTDLMLIVIVMMTRMRIEV